jgi:hypothetical protein
MRLYILPGRPLSLSRTCGAVDNPFGAGILRLTARAARHRASPLAVGVPGAAAAANPPLAWLALWPGRAPDSHAAHRAVAELGVEPPHQVAGEQPQLCRPGGRVRRDRELAVGQRVWLRVSRELRADNLGPSSENRPGCCGQLPAVLGQQPVECRSQWLGVIMPLPWPGPAPRHCPGPWHCPGRWRWPWLGPLDRLSRSCWYCRRPCSGGWPERRLLLSRGHGPDVASQRL